MRTCLYSKCTKRFKPTKDDHVYCCDGHRSAAYQESIRIAARAARSQSDAPESQEISAEADTERQRKRTGRLASASSTPLSRRPRIPLEDQLVSQAPLPTHSYRVLLGVNQFGSPQYVPEQNQTWCLLPFQPPTDPRLEDGKTYRVEWFDRHGRELPPRDDHPIPALHFFLGPPDAHLSAETARSRPMASPDTALRTELRQAQEQGQAQLRRFQRALKQQRLATRRVQAQLTKAKKKERRAERSGVSLPMLAALLGTTAVLARTTFFGSLGGGATSLLSRLRAALRDPKPLREIGFSLLELAKTILDSLEIVLRAVPQFRQAWAKLSEKPDPESASSAPADSQQVTPTPSAATEHNSVPAASQQEQQTKGPRSVLPEEQADLWLMEFCDLPLQEAPSSGGGTAWIETEEPLAYTLVLNMRPAVWEQWADAPGWSLFRDSFCAATGLSQLCAKIEQAASAPSPFQGRAVSPEALTFAQVGLETQEKLHQTLLSIEQSKRVTEASLEGLWQIAAQVKGVLRGATPPPADPLAQVLHDALLSIRRTLRHDLIATTHKLEEAAQAAGSEGVLPIEAPPAGWTVAPTSQASPTGNPGAAPRKGAPTAHDNPASAPDAIGSLEGPRRALSEDQADDWLMELCELPPPEPSPPTRDDSRIELEDPVAYTLVRSMQPAVWERRKQEHFWDPFCAATGLTQLCEKIEHAANEKVAFKGRAVTPRTLALVEVARTTQEQLRQSLVSITQSRRITQATLKALQPTVSNVKAALIEASPPPEDPLAQVLHDALLSIWRVLEYYLAYTATELAEADAETGTKGVIVIKKPPARRTAADIAARKAELAALAPQEWVERRTRVVDTPSAGAQPTLTPSVPAGSENAAADKTQMPQAQPTKAPGKTAHLEGTAKKKKARTAGPGATGTAHPASDHASEKAA